MSIKEFNREYSIFSSRKTILSEEDETLLNSLLVRTIASTNPDELCARTLETAVFFSNINELVQISNHTSPLIWTCTEALCKSILNGRNQDYLVKEMRCLPILVDALVTTSDMTKLKSLLNLIQEMTYGIEIKVRETFVDKLIKELLRFLTSIDEQFERLHEVALSVLINVCYKNPSSLQVLQREVHLVKFQKQIQIGKYGILACKMNLILNEISHILTAADFRNFLNFIENEVSSYIKSGNVIAFKHVIAFIRDMQLNKTSRNVLVEHDFRPLVVRTLSYIEQTDVSKPCMSAILELLHIIIESTNKSLNPIQLTITTFAIKEIKHEECAVESLNILRFILDSDDPTMNVNHIEFDDLEDAINALLRMEIKPCYIIPLLKLVVILQARHSIKILDDPIVNRLLGPLLESSDFNYSSLSCETITMYLQCLRTLQNLSEFSKDSNRKLVEVLLLKNIQYLIGMAIKTGDREQCCMALEVAKTCSVSIDYLSQVISDNSHEDMNDVHNSSFTFSQPLMSVRRNDNVLSTEIGKVEKTIEQITRALNNKELNNIPATSFIELYECRIMDLQQKIGSLTNDLNEATKQITKQAQKECRNMKLWTNYADLCVSLQSSNENLLSDKQHLEKNIIVLKEAVHKMGITCKQSTEANAQFEAKNKTLVTENEGLKQTVRENGKTIFDMQVAIKEKSKQIENLENELREGEDMRHTILSLMQNKRKK